MAVQAPPGATAIWFGGQGDIPRLRYAIFVRASTVHSSRPTAKGCLMAASISLTQAVNLTA